MPDEDPTRPKRRLRRLLKTVVVLAVALAAVALAAKWWLLPAVIRGQLSRAVAFYWDGRLEIGEVDFNYFGPTRLRLVSLTDPNGRAWFRADTITATFRDWPGFHPFLTDLDVYEADVTLHVVDGRCAPPLITPDRELPSVVDQYLDLRTVRAECVSVLVDHDTGRKLAYSWVASATRKRHPLYEIRLDDGSAGPQARSLAGELDVSTLEAKLHARIDRRLSEDEAALLLRMLGVTNVRDAAASVRLGVSLDGPLTRPEAMKAAGSLAVTRGRAATADGSIVTDFSCRVRFGGGRGTIEQAEAVAPVATLALSDCPFTYDANGTTVSADVTASLTFREGEAGGFWQPLLKGTTVRGAATAAGRVAFNRRRPQPWDFDLTVTGELAEVRFADDPERNLSAVKASQLRLRPARVDANDVTATLATGRARARLMLELTGAGGQVGSPALSDWWRVERLAGGGHVFMDDVDLVAVPLLPELLKAMRVLPKEQKGVSDVDALLRLSGGVVTIERGRLASPLSAMEVEKGGTIDLRTKQLDLYMIVVPLRQLRSLLKAIPLIKLAVNLRDKLTRFRVLGRWDEPATKLLAKAPMGQIGKGTEAFFKGVVETGGQIGPGLIKGIGGFFKAIDAGLKGKSPR